ncbi:diaminopimelate decarboxylase [Fodinibius halophilus]|uniref:Diaminopimelate decarboxylase n=1 Tax=Fodinibius halophilus TaxID=1736908 RepID=A0A6M1TAM2_9BACT|nr:diaminopimelate decarboxylase [Fodinibius halophilus]NGP89071.1 diaminopimelate decarboxylase [Fodinibius halophilus]
MQLKNATYHIQDISMEALAEKYGTPLFVYNAFTIDRQINRLQNAFDGFPHRINYAAKSLTNIAVLKLMCSYGLGLDVVSVNELQMGLDAGFDADDILFTSNSVSFEEIKEAIARGVKVNIDSLSLLETFGKEYGGSQPCSIRLKLDPLVGEHEASTEWHNKSKFGIHYSRLDDIKALIDTYNLDIVGLHVHNSSSFLDIPVYVKAAKRMFDIARSFEGLDFIDFGGGITVPFHPEDETIDVNKLGKALTTEVHSFYDDYGSRPEIWFEPGRFLVSECGYLLCSVTVLKGDRDLPYAGTDTGFNHLLRPKLYGAYHDICNISNPEGELQNYHITGNMCETDFLGRDRPVARIREGDILCIKNAGAYGACMASNYNSRLRPAEVMIREGKVQLIRERETYEDLVRNQLDVSW